VPNNPKKWIAALLGFFALPIAFMYVGRLRLAGIYLLAALVISVAVIFYLHGTDTHLVISALALQITAAVHAFRLADRYPDDKPRPAYSRWYGLIGASAVLVAVAVGIRAFAIEPFRIPSGSMLPTLPLKSHILVGKWGYGHYSAYGFTLLKAPISAPLERGDILVFSYPDDPSAIFAKRLIGLPGDNIVYREKQLSINGHPVPRRSEGQYLDRMSPRVMERYAESLSGTDYSTLIDPDAPASIQYTRPFPFHEKCVSYADGVSCEVPPGHYFMMGDNRDNSVDSRIRGFIPASNIVGKVVRIIP